MSSSYKFYSDTKDIMKKYVNATEGAIIYGISKSRIMVLASEAGAVYKVGNSALINTDSFVGLLKYHTLEECSFLSWLCLDRLFPRIAFTFEHTVFNSF